MESLWYLSVWHTVVNVNTLYIPWKTPFWKASFMYVMQCKYHYIHCGPHWLKGSVVLFMHALLPLRRWQDAISIRALSGSSDLQLAPLQIKESQTFKFCRCLKAPNTMTGFSSRSSNSCFVFHPKIAPQTISKGLKSKIFQWGVMPPDTPSRSASQNLLHCPQYIHTGNPFSKPYFHHWHRQRFGCQVGQVGTKLLPSVRKYWCPVLCDTHAGHRNSNFLIQENQLKKLTELNLTAVSDYATRSMAAKQVT